MIDEQLLLEAQYKSLRDSRTGPVFFIEHGLGEAEVADLLEQVRTSMKTHALNSTWWAANSLPLLVAATEVGYRYRGTGTDFWPILEEQLGARIGNQGRERIRDLFAVAATTFRGARPPDTPWARAFNLIAWPITHALLPLEFHRTLSLALAKLRAHVADLEDEPLLRAIRIAAATPSARFATLLESDGLIVSVVRSLLGVDTGQISPAITLRIARDLESDQFARRSFTAARQIQRGVEKQGRARPQNRDPTPSIEGTLQLRRREKALTLEASFPSLDPELATRLRRTLRRHRFAPKLWGVTARVPSEQMLSGLPFSLKFDSAPAANAVLLPELEALGIEPDLHEVLAGLVLPLDPPLLFAIGGDGEVGRIVRTPSISGYRKYWVLTLGRHSTVSDRYKIGAIGPYTCYALDPTENDQCRALAELGYTSRFGVSVSIIGPPRLIRDTSNPAFASGDTLIIVPRRTSAEGLLVQINGVATGAADNEVVRTVVSEGENLVQVASGGESREFTYRGLTSAPTPAPAPCVVEVHSSEVTVQAFTSGTLAFAIQSFAPLEGLDITVELHVGDRTFSASAPLEPLPQLITTKHEAFTTLLDDSMRELLLQTPDPVLQIRVGRLCSRAWTLEHRVRPFWWIRNPGGDHLLKSELGDLPHGAVVATAPHLPPSPTLHPSNSEAFLLAPLHPNPAEYGPTAAFSTLCIAPTRASLIPPPMTKPRIQRRRRGVLGDLGVEDLFEAYFRWSLAETDTGTAELRRQQITNEIDGWIAEVCCGSNWHRGEQQISNQNAWQLLVELGHEARLGRDSYHRLSDDVWRNVLAAAVAQVRQDFPRLWSIVRLPDGLVEQDWVLLRQACDNAYQIMSRRYQLRGETDVANALAEADSSADFKPSAWQTVFEMVMRIAEQAHLGALLLPTDSALDLMALDPGLSLNEFSEGLHRWATQCQGALAGAVPSEITLRTILALWTEPETAVTLDWRSALDVLISERAVARAARYLALRTRQAREFGGV